MTDQELLDTHAQLTSDGRWHFGDLGNTHTRDEALAVIRACQLLDAPITDQLTAQAWLSIAQTLADLRRRVEAIERRQLIRG